MAWNDFGADSIHYIDDDGNAYVKNGVNEAAEFEQQMADAGKNVTKRTVTVFEDDQGVRHRVPEGRFGEFAQAAKDEGRKFGEVKNYVNAKTGAGRQFVLWDRDAALNSNDPVLQAKVAESRDTYSKLVSEGYQDRQTMAPSKWDAWKRLLSGDGWGAKNYEGYSVKDAAGVFGSTVLAGLTGIEKGIVDTASNSIATQARLVGLGGFADKIAEVRKFNDMLMDREDATRAMVGEGWLADGGSDAMEVPLQFSEGVGSLYGFGKLVGGAAKGVRLGMKSVGEAAKDSTVLSANVANKIRQGAIAVRGSARVGTLAAAMGADAFENALESPVDQNDPEGSKQLKDLGAKGYLVAAANAVVSAATAKLFGKLTGILPRDVAAKTAARSVGKATAQTALEMAEFAGINDLGVVTDESARALAGVDKFDLERLGSRITSASVDGMGMALALRTGGVVTRTAPAAARRAIDAINESRLGYVGSALEQYRNFYTTIDTNLEGKLPLWRTEPDGRVVLDKQAVDSMVQQGMDLFPRERDDSTPHVAGVDQNGTIKMTDGALIVNAGYDQVTGAVDPVVVVNDGTHLNRAGRVTTVSAGPNGQRPDGSFGPVVPAPAKGQKYPIQTVRLAAGLVESMRADQVAPEMIPTESINADDVVPNWDGTPLQANAEAIDGKYDATKAGTVILWEDANGNRYVVQGRARTMAAKAAGVKSVPAIVLKESDGWTSDLVPMVGGVDRLMRGKMEPGEAARFIRDMGLSNSELDAMGLDSKVPGSRYLAQNGTALLIDGETGVGRVPFETALGMTRELNIKNSGLSVDDVERVQRRLLMFVEDQNDPRLVRVAGIVRELVQDGADVSGEGLDATIRRAREILFERENAERAGANGTTPEVEERIGTVPVETADGIVPMSEVERRSAPAVEQRPAEGLDERRTDLDVSRKGDGEYACTRFPEMKIRAVEGAIVCDMSAEEMLAPKNVEDMQEFLVRLGSAAARDGVKLTFADPQAQLAAQKLLTERLMADRAQQLRGESAERTERQLEARKTIVEAMMPSGLVEEVVVDPVRFRQVLEENGGKGKMWINSMNEVQGFFLDGKVYLNPDVVNANTPIHEFAHPAVELCKQVNPAVYNRGLELVAETEWFREVAGDKVYAGDSRESQLQEALVRVIETRGAELANESEGMRQRIKDWLVEFWKGFGEAMGLGEITADQAENMTLEQVADAIRAEMMSGRRFGEKPGADSIGPRPGIMASSPEDLKFSIKRNEELMTKARELNVKLGSRVPDGMLLQAAQDRVRAKSMLTTMDGLNLPPDIEGKTSFGNASYGKTMENTTLCTRTLGVRSLTAEVAKLFGRPLTVEEQLFVAQEAMTYTSKPQCLYCYVAMDRMAKEEFFGKYIDARDRVIKDLRSGMPEKKAYEKFLDGRKDTDQMRSRFRMWKNISENGGQLLTKRDVSSHVTRAEAASNEALKAQLADAERYAQAASWAKKPYDYRAYDGEIQRWSEGVVRKLNQSFGLRFHSFSEASPAFILEKMQMITDGAVRGLKGLEYTKEPWEVEIFGKTGVNFNMGVFGFEDPHSGKILCDGMQGMEWTEAQRLRKKYPNAGVVFVATNDKQVKWAGEQDWIDIVIPYHIVRTGANVAKMMGWKNYKDFQEDMKDPDAWQKGMKKHILPADHNNDRDTYFRLLKENGLKPRFPQWVNEPWYMKLVNETRVPANQTPAMMPVFDLAVAESALEEMQNRGGYFERIGWNVEGEREIAQNIAGKIERGEPATAPKIKLSWRSVPQEVIESDGVIDRYISNLEKIEGGKISSGEFRKRVNSAMGGTDHLSLGVPTGMIEGLIPANEVRLSVDVLLRKMSETYKNNHPFSFSDVRGLASNVMFPAIVLKNENNPGIRVLFKTQTDKNFLVAIAPDGDVNEIKTIFPKDLDRLSVWLSTIDPSQLLKISNEKIDLLLACRSNTDLNVQRNLLAAKKRILNSFSAVNGKNEKIELSHRVDAAGQALDALLVDGQVRVAAAGEAGEQTPGGYFGGEELLARENTPALNQDIARPMSLAASELVTLYKRLTDGKLPATVRGTAGQNWSAGRLTSSGRVEVLKGLFGVVDSSDQAELKRQLRTLGYFQADDPIWCATHAPEEVELDRASSREALVNALKDLGERRINGAESGGQRAAVSVMAHEIGKLAIDLPANAGGSMGRMGTLGRGILASVGRAGVDVETVSKDYLKWFTGARTPEQITAIDGQSKKDLIGGMFGAFLVAPQTVQNRAPAVYDAMVHAISSNNRLASAFFDLKLTAMDEGPAERVMRDIEKQRTLDTERAVTRLQDEINKPTGTTGQKVRDSLIYAFDDVQGPMYMRIRDGQKQRLAGLKQLLKEGRITQQQYDAVAGDFERQLEALKISQLAVDRGQGGEIRAYVWEQNLAIRQAISEGVDIKQWYRYGKCMRIIETQGRASDGGMSPREAQQVLDRMYERLGPQKYAQIEALSKQFQAIRERAILNDPRVARVFGQSLVDYWKSNVHYVRTDRNTLTAEQIERIEADRAAWRAAHPREDDIVGDMLKMVKKIGGTGTGGTVDAFTAALEGSLRPSRDWIEATLRNDSNIIRFVEHNNFVISMRDAMLAAKVEGVHDLPASQNRYPNNERYGTIGYVEDGQKRVLVVPRIIADGYKHKSEQLIGWGNVSRLLHGTMIDWNLMYTPRNLNRNMATAEALLPGMHATALTTVGRAVLPGVSRWADMIRTQLARHMSEKAAGVLGRNILGNENTMLFWARPAQRVLELIQDPSKVPELRAKAEAAADAGDPAELQQLSDDLDMAREIMKSNVLITRQGQVRGEGFLTDFMKSNNLKGLYEEGEAAKKSLMQRMADSGLNVWSRNSKANDALELWAKVAAYMQQRSYDPSKTPAERGLFVANNASIPVYERHGQFKGFIENAFNMFWNTAKAGAKRTWSAWSTRPESLAKVGVQSLLPRFVWGAGIVGGGFAAMIRAMYNDDEKQIQESPYAGVYDYLNWVREQYLNLSEYRKRYYSEIPIASFGNVTLSIGAPLTDEEKLLTPVVDWMVANLAPNPTDPSISASTAVGMAVQGSLLPDLSTRSPMVALFQDTVMSLMGLNPFDTYRGASVYDQGLLDARFESMEMFTEYLKKVAQQAGNDIGMRAVLPGVRNGVDAGAEDVPRLIQIALRQIPIVSPVLASCFHLSTGGIDAKLRELDKIDAPRRGLRKVKVGHLVEDAINRGYLEIDIEKLDAIAAKYEFNEAERIEVFVKATNKMIAHKFPQEYKKEARVLKKIEKMSDADADRARRYLGQ